MAFAFDCELNGGVVSMWIAALALLILFLSAINVICGKTRSVAGGSQSMFEVETLASQEESTRVESQRIREKRASNDSHHGQKARHSNESGTSRRTKDGESKKQKVLESSSESASIHKISIRTRASSIANSRERQRNPPTDTPTGPPARKQVLRYQSKRTPILYNRNSSSITNNSESSFVWNKQSKNKKNIPGERKVLQF
ncbi:hypothetical protein Y032_0027g1546 [Ancylostoma ceylanicum]|uniref:Uncharacterized protein n=1 Tax=Ancylostoma ceylanicum TaxID=53326 RepID=A0A016USU2_9BILA|nr:hypothetical protein Y032_0027g1546 [Ancylostoma ceylanicum]